MMFRSVVVAKTAHPLIPWGRGGGGRRRWQLQGRGCSDQRLLVVLEDSVDRLKLWSRSQLLELRVAGDRIKVPYGRRELIRTRMLTT